MALDRHAILELFRHGSPDEREAFVDACPPHSSRDAAARMARAEDVVERVKALGILTAEYCTAARTAGLGAEAAIAGYEFGTEVQRDHPSLPPDTLSRLALDGVAALRLQGRNDEALALCDRLLPIQDARDPSGLNAQLLRKARIELLLDLDRIPEAEEALDAFAATASGAGVAFVAALRQRLAAKRGASGIPDRAPDTREEASPVEQGTTGAEPVDFSPPEPSRPEEGSQPLDVARPKRAARPRKATRGGARSAPPSDEGTQVTRYPHIGADGRMEPRAELEITVDLAMTPDPDTESLEMKMRFPFLPSQRELPVRVTLVAPELSFEEGQDEGVITVKRDAPSTAWKTHARVAADLEGREAIVIQASFSYGGRHCGSARRAFLVAGNAGASVPGGRRREAPGGATAPSPTSAAGEVVVPEPRVVEAPRGRTAGAFSVEPGAPAPKVTIEMFGVERRAGAFTWHLDLPEDVRQTPGLPRRLTDTVELGGEVPTFVAGLFEDVDALSRDHLAFFQGLGDRLYELTPPFFKQAYWALVDRFGTDFPIQIVSDDPYVPWELMRPSRNGTPSQILAVSHSVGRWFLDYEDCLRASIRRGKVVTLAPDYAARTELDPLPAARAESEAVLKALKQGAQEIRADKKDVLELLADAQQADVALVHFAGHGSAPVKQTTRALLCLEDADLHVFEIERLETQLGVHRHPLVLLNACELARSGLNLGVIGGFAEALMKREFGGFIAPLWAVYDGAAAKVTESFVCDVLQKNRDFASALRDIRKTYGERSPTFFSYVYYGDVMARFV